MPFPWTPPAIARTAALIAVTALASAAGTRALASHLLLPDEVLAAVEPDSPIGADLDEPGSDPAPRGGAPKPDLAAVTDAQRRTARAGWIVEHNPFCRDCRPVEVTDASAAESDPRVRATELPLALVATMEASEPAESLATIRDTERRATGLFGVGDEIRPGVVVAGVQPGLVVLREREGLRTLGFPDPKAKPAPAPAAKPAPAKRNSREIPGAREAIACTGTSCTVDRSFVEKLLANPRQLARQAKLVPAVKDGETRGFRIHRVRPGTLPKLLGLKNGDTLVAVNGTDLDSMDQAIGLYTKLRRASELSLTVERKGQVFEQHISIR